MKSISKSAYRQARTDRGPTIAAMRAPALAAVLALAFAAPALAVPPAPIPEGADAGSLPVFTGAPATQRPVAAADPPRHPFMAPNGRSNLHVDAFQTDVHQGPGPLGHSTRRVETFVEGDCASVTFDSRGRIVTVCVGLEGPKLFRMDARTLETLATFPLPPRLPGGGNPFNDFAGGGYFFLDHRDRAVIPTTTRHVLVVRGAADGQGFELERDYDLGAAVAPGDKVVSALPDWSGRLWFVSSAGVVGTVDPASGAVRSLALGEPVTNSFAADDEGAVYVVSDAALYRMHAAADGRPAVVWREIYENSGIAKPGQVGSGVGDDADADGERARGDHRQRGPDERRGLPPRRDRERVAPRVCASRSSSAARARRTTRSSRPAARWWSRTTTATPGRPRRRAAARPPRASSAWTSTPTARAAAACGAPHETAPTVVPKLSAANGIVYTYTKDPQPQKPDADAWYLTALDFRTGRTLFKRLGGEGLGHNNNYAPITLGPDATAYIGVLGGLVALRDTAGPLAGAGGGAGPGGGPGSGAAGRRGGLHLRVRRLRSGRLRVRVVGAGTRHVRRVHFYARHHRVRRDTKRPFRGRVGRRDQARRSRTKVEARILLWDGSRVNRVRRVGPRR